MSRKTIEIIYLLLAIIACAIAIFFYFQEDSENKKHIIFLVIGLLLLSLHPFLFRKEYRERKNNNKNIWYTNHYCKDDE